MATLLLFVISPFVASGSLGHSALQGMLPFTGILAIAAIGQTLVIQQGGLDLSVPGIFSMGAVLVVTIPGGSEGSLIPALLVVAAVGLAGGLLNGIAVTRFGITPLVATLGSNAIFIGVVIQATGGSIAFKATKNWQEFTADKAFGIPVLAVIAVIAAVLVALFISRTIWGRRFVLVGSSPLAARAAGLSVERYQIGAYAGAGLAYALAGALLSGYLQSPPLLPGNEYLLPTIAAVVLGGTALGGGRGIRHRDHGRRPLPQPARTGGLGARRQNLGPVPDPGRDRRPRHGHPQRPLEPHPARPLRRRRLGRPGPTGAAAQHDFPRHRERRQPHRFSVNTRRRSY